MNPQFSSSIESKIQRAATEIDDQAIMLVLDTHLGARAIHAQARLEAIAQQAQLALELLHTLSPETCLKPLPLPTKLQARMSLPESPGKA